MTADGWIRIYRPDPTKFGGYTRYSCQTTIPNWWCVTSGISQVCTSEDHIPNDVREEADDLCPNRAK